MVYRGLYFKNYQNCLWDRDSIEKCGGQSICYLQHVIQVLETVQVLETQYAKQFQWLYTASFVKLAEM